MLIRIEKDRQMVGGHLARQLAELLHHHVGFRAHLTDLLVCESDADVFRDEIACRGPGHGRVNRHCFAGGVDGADLSVHHFAPEVIADDFFAS